ncbi:glycosyltransferase [Segetibacter aerophilus]|uniref:Glycosyl transferase n=1 Tax=Segetibacter aerophilus TaxID=670293 RepID=A0A512B6M8_9BACT|nr:glycosyltransferase [Segetibacter aerophilus]GEO07624.1 glycosyl transferase [Segetibacter aerophilus]
MKILIVMDPGILVPPKGYGGHERLVALFAREYQRVGHEVHLLVTAGSFVEGCITHAFGKEGFPPKHSDALKAIPTAWKFLWAHRNDFDLIHNFGRLVYLLPVLNKRVKKIMTYGREISKRNIRYINELPLNNIVFTGCSNNLVSRGNVAGKWKTVYNAIDFNKYQLQEKTVAEAPLIFLGRIEKVKGCHTAISIAKATNNKLIIAGNISPLADEQEYFKQEIEPYIDGKQILHVGPVNDIQKNGFLGQSKALLFPIEWNEPFGIVMIEAMACGTPVIAFNKGSVEEVVDEGCTGYKVNTAAEMKDAVHRIHNIDRRNCREHAKKRFDVKVVSAQYLSLNR